MNRRYRRNGWRALLLGAAVSLPFWAFVAGTERARWAATRIVPNSTVSSWWCDADGGTAYVVEHPLNTGVYAIHCKDGFVAKGGNK